MECAIPYSLTIPRVGHAKHIATYNDRRIRVLAGPGLDIKLLFPSLAIVSRYSDSQGRSTIRVHCRIVREDEKAAPVPHQVDTAVVAGKGSSIGFCPTHPVVGGIRPVHTSYRGAQQHVHASGCALPQRWLDQASCSPRFIEFTAPDLDRSGIVSISVRDIEKWTLDPGVPTI